MSCEYSFLKASCMCQCRVKATHEATVWAVLCPVKSACHHWLNVFFLSFYGADMFLLPSAHSSFCQRVRQCKGCLFNHLLSADYWPAAQVCHTWHNKGTVEGLTGFLPKFSLVVFSRNYFSHLSFFKWKLECESCDLLICLQWR